MVHEYLPLNCILSPYLLTEASMLWITVSFCPAQQTDQAATQVVSPAFLFAQSRFAYRRSELVPKWFRSQAFAPNHFGQTTLGRNDSGRTRSGRNDWKPYELSFFLFPWERTQNKPDGLSNDTLRNHAQHKPNIMILFITTHNINQTMLDIIE